jgi:nucleotide-binding universal stress UspA family protein
VRRFTVTTGSSVGVPSAGRVLVAVDFGAPSLAAARWVARRLAPEAELVLAHVLPVPQAPPFLRGLLRSPDAFVREVAAPMRGGLEGLAASLGAPRVRVVLRVGDPAEQLAQIAAAEEVELICVGRPRERGHTAKLGRNTVDRLLRRTPIPLIQASGALEAPPTRVLAAVDGGGASAQVLRHAGAIAARLGIPITALHVLDEDVRAYARAMEVAVGSAAQAQAAEDALRDAIARWLTRALEASGAGHARAMVGRGDPGQEVLAARKRSGADLIVLGRSGHDALGAHAVGSTTRLVLRAAPCPVLVVPDAPAPAAPPDDGTPRRSTRSAARAATVLHRRAPWSAPAEGSGDGGAPPAAELRPA